MMFLRVLLFASIFGGCFLVYGLVPVPPLYKKAEIALKSYVSNPSHNPIIYSLLNVFIHDKQGRAFISDRAIELALIQVKEFDRKMKTNNEKLLRQFIYGMNCKRNGKTCVPSYRQKTPPTTPDIKQQIVVALDQFFEGPNSEDEEPVIPNNEDKM